MQNLGQKVIYQIYPKSFYDANGDGIGDLRGIIEKIDYIKKLNVDMIWFNPFYVSPQNDNGYDIANYREIDPLFGTMNDFEELQAKLADIGVGVMLDMVLNHCSTEHEWFKMALAGDEKYRKFFYLRPGKPDGGLPNNWQSKFGGRPGPNLVTLTFTTSTSMTRPRLIWTGTIRKSERNWKTWSTSGGARGSGASASMSST